MSFVVVHFSDDYFHNILRSECVHRPLNELITIDNRQNLRHDNLSQAINAGIARATHDIVAIVHEDVVLPPGWQQRFEESLAELERYDPHWGLLGSAGWDHESQLIGHWSDPHQYSNTFTDRPFEPVRNIDEQLMILRTSTGVRLDDELPSIHNVGRDLASTLRARGLQTYVVDAPTIHKYADESGRPIRMKEDSPKIMARELPSYLADLASSDEYLFRKWPEWRPAEHREPDLELESFSKATLEALDRPIILLSRGGSGSRLLSTLAQDLGVFLGTEINESGDSLEMVDAIYRGVLDRYLHRAEWQKERIVPRLRLAAAGMLEHSGRSPSTWGFKLPEAMLVVPELLEAFPAARFIHMIRDPLTTCLRRTHMTARFDNPIGRVAIREAYRHVGRSVEQSLSDSPAVRMAYTTIHQIEFARAHTQRLGPETWREIRFESVLASPGDVVHSTSEWMTAEPSGDRLGSLVDPRRASNPRVRYPSAVEASVAEILHQLRQSLGYCR